VTVSNHKAAGIWVLLTASGVSVTGDGIIAAAVPLLAASITRDPIAVSAVTAANYLPWILVGLISGALSDRWPRRTTMIFADLVRAALLATLILLIFLELMTVPLLATLIFLLGCGQCFFDAASQAIVPTLVGRDPEELTLANSRVWALDTIGRQFVGPPAGSALFSIFSFLPFLLNAISFVLSALILRHLPDVRIPASENRVRPSTAIKDGLRHILVTPALSLAATYTAIFNLGFNAAFAVLVLFSGDKLGLSSAQFGLLITVMAVGSIIGSQYAPLLARRIATILLYAGSLVVASCGWLTVSLAPNVVVAALGLVAVGASAMLGSVVVGTQRQLHTPDQMLGSVVATFRLAGMGAAGLGALTGGALAGWAGLASPFFVSLALLPVAGAALLALRRRAARLSAP
jgi:MFS family permease